MRSIENGKEIYDFINAEMVDPNAWSDGALWNIGVLLAKMHKAGAEFIPAENFGCKPWYLREIGSERRIWCHGDVAPWNMLTLGGQPHALVDWEFAGPLDPFVEFARVCWLFVQLCDDEIAAKYNLPSPQKRAEQVRIICYAYGLKPTLRKRLVEQIIEVIICETAHEAIDPNITMSGTGSLWGFAWRTRSLYWIWRNREILENALY